MQDKVRNRTINLIVLAGWRNLAGQQFSQSVDLPSSSRSNFHWQDTFIPFQWQLVLCWQLTNGKLIVQINQEVKKVGVASAPAQVLRIFMRLARDRILSSATNEREMDLIKLCQNATACVSLGELNGTRATSIRALLLSLKFHDCSSSSPVHHLWLQKMGDMCDVVLGNAFSNELTSVPQSLWPSRIAPNNHSLLLSRFVIIM